MAKPLNFEPGSDIRCREFKIRCIGAGFIMADVQLSAYAMARFPVVAIASRRAEKAAEVANRWKIPTVHQTPHQLIEDSNVEIVDIAFPPDQQPELIRHALKQKHVRAILAQKPLAMDFWLAKALVEEAATTDKVLSVNQNMRFDQSMRALKQLLDRNELRMPILET